MKLNNLLNLTVLGTTLAFASGCRHTSPGITKIPGGSENIAADPNRNGLNGLTNGTILTPNNPPIGEPISTTQHPPGDGHTGWIPDPTEPLKSQTVYFAYDKASVPAAEMAKLDMVANYLKANPGVAVKVEGNCDERGTEEYNRSLGERRALAAREHLIQLGIPAGTVDTITYGKDKPAVNGHDEKAWAKNRRDDFIVLRPPGSAQ